MIPDAVQALEPLNLVTLTSCVQSTMKTITWLFDIMIVTIEAAPYRQIETANNQPRDFWRNTCFSIPWTDRVVPHRVTAAKLLHALLSAGQVAPDTAEFFCYHDFSWNTPSDNNGHNQITLNCEHEWSISRAKADKVKPDLQPSYGTVSSHK